MKNILVSMVAVFILSFGATGTALAKSACSGLSKSSCAAKSSMCTWRKSSVDKNGKKTKAHCRALPGKSKKRATKSKSSKKKKKAKSKS